MEAGECDHECGHKFLYGSIMTLVIGEHEYHLHKEMLEWRSPIIKAQIERAGKYENVDRFVSQLKSLSPAIAATANDHLVSRANQKTTLRAKIRRELEEVAKIETEHLAQSQITFIVKDKITIPAKDCSTAAIQMVIKAIYHEADHILHKKTHDPSFWRLLVDAFRFADQLQVADLQLIVVGTFKDAYYRDSGRQCRDQLSDLHDLLKRYPVNNPAMGRLLSRLQENEGEMEAEEEEEEGEGGEESEDE